MAKFHTNPMGDYAKKQQKKKSRASKALSHAYAA